ncbi:MULTISPECIES: CGNR zinc finger domain-containing protein [unclassified Crossiella]|uniref:CGNR zinc finger domain-containing protein n=1 Tax=unclassified Crossiella TaxID=2620835 RepID=UPI002000131C|nr:MULTISPECIES: CGNR zinc finger domain-containing protein [unclassified Crossiella]MCK2243756.1 CGNR zinc finger domain-containing protein [Crossiella sp. S99.2]MCK2257615.1 CGNR zinc finger domain-containing protein [Crossiella sp. S99.1]
MALSDYTGRAVLTAVDLVNSQQVLTGQDTLTAEAELAGLLGARGWVLDRPLVTTDLERLRALRPRLRFVFGGTPVRKSVEDLNALLRELGAQPQLTDHDGGWHWHYVRPRAPLAERVATTCVVALLTVIADGGAARLRICEGTGCGNVFVDASRPNSRRFCDTKGCGNRAHVTAYRERRKQRSPE